MPWVTLLDGYGNNWRIATMNEATLQAWFGEWLHRVWNPALTFGGQPEPQVIVYPLWDATAPDGKPAAPDWLSDSRVISEPFVIPRDPAQVLPALKAKRAELEQKIADADARGERFIS